MQTVTITTEFIKLQDLLKFADLVSSGGEAISVDGEPCLQRGKKIKPGQTVTFQNRDFSVVYADS